MLAQKFHLLIAYQQFVQVTGADIEEVSNAIGFDRGLEEIFLNLLLVSEVHAFKKIYLT